MPNRSKRRKPLSDVRLNAASEGAEATEETILAAELARQTERLFFEFIRNELELGLTFAKAAQSYKDPHRIKQATDNATLAYRTVLEKLPKVQLSPRDRNWIEQQTEKLKLAPSEKYLNVDDWEDKVASGQEAVSRLRRFYPRGQQLLPELRRSAF